MKAIIVTIKIATAEIDSRTETESQDRKNKLIMTILVFDA